MGEVNEEEEKWLNQYSSNHKILLVGEGDFSFSLSLALAFTSASHILATSLHSYDEVIKNFKKAKANLESLEKLGGSHSHGIDATKMKRYPKFQMRRFDRIIFNFPHAGFCGQEASIRMINKHQNLLNGFFMNARGMLRGDGEIHVTHKTSAPYCHWNLEGLASKSSLKLIGSIGFRKHDYPGYQNKRGDGPRCDAPFHLGNCRTFMFRLSPSAKLLLVNAYTHSRDGGSLQTRQVVAQKEKRKERAVNPERSLRITVRNEESSGRAYRDVTYSLPGRLWLHSEIVVPKKN